MLTQTFGVANKEHYGMLWYFLEWSVETVSNINCSTVVFILLDFLQTRGVIFTLSLFLLVRFWNEKCLSILFYYIFHLLQPCYRNIYFALSCCWGEVVVPRHKENQQNSETLNHHKYESWTRTQHWMDQCYMLISENSKYLFCSCFTVAGYFISYFISFYLLYLYVSVTFSFSNKLPFESKSSYVLQVLFQLLSSLSPYHLFSMYS